MSRLRHRQRERVAARGGDERQSDSVLPLVGSMISRPARDAALLGVHTIAAPRRHLTE